MNKSTIAIIGLALCANLSLAAAQTCKTSIIKTTPAADFEINNDGTVVHKTTGLMWKRCSEGLSGANCEKGTAKKRFTWAGALNHVVELNKTDFAGHSDWRLPNIKELLSIVERSCKDPAINATVFPNTSGWYWSASPNAGNSDYAWVVNFYYGGVSSSYKNGAGRVRLVRSK